MVLLHPVAGERQRTFPPCLSGLFVVQRLHTWEGHGLTGSGLGSCAFPQSHHDQSSSQERGQLVLVTTGR